MNCKIQFFSLLIIIMLVGMMGCEIEPQKADFLLTNSPPETILAPTPADSSMNNPFKIKLQWHGNDVDGRVVKYHYRLKGELFDNDSTETWYETDLFFVNVKLRNGWYRLWVKAEDDKGAIDATPDSVTFHVKGPTFDKGILLVDDDNLTDDDRDSEKDALYDKLMANAGFPNYTQWDYETKFGLTEEPVFTGQGVDLNGEVYDGLASYSSVIWYVGGKIYDSDKELNSEEPTAKNIMKNINILSDYLDMGGNLWIAGVQPVISITGTVPDGSLFPENQFIRKYLRIRSALPVEVEIDELISMKYPEYPDITTFYVNPRNPSIKNFLGYNEKTTSTNPYIYCTNQIVPEVDAEVLYIFNDNVRIEVVNRTEHQVNSEEFAHTPCAIRYVGPYKVIVFGFPLVRTAKRGRRGEDNLMNAEAMTQVFKHILHDEFGEPFQTE